MSEHATQVADGVWRGSGSRTEFYVVTDGGAATLIDTGYPRDRGRVEAALAAAGSSPADVAAVVATHGHVDHIGSAAALRARHGTRILAHRDELPNLTGEREERIATGDIIRRLWSPSMLSFVVNVVRAGGLDLDHVEDAATFEEGRPLDVPGSPVPVATPGHTSGHCCFHLPDRGVLVTGDALVTRDPLGGRSGPQLINRLFNHDHDRAVRSLAALRGLEAEVLLPGHGDPYRGRPDGAVAAALDAEQRRRR